jgi:hypothetical protein
LDKPLNGSFHSQNKILEVLILANLRRVGEFNFVILRGSIGNVDWKLDLNSFGTWCELIGNIKIQKIQLPPPKGLVGFLLPCLPFFASTKY